MKKTCIVLLALMALVFCLTPALAAPISIDLNTSDADSVLVSGITGMAPVEDGLLLTVWDAAFFWDMTGEPQKVTVTVPPDEDATAIGRYHVLGAGDRLYFLNDVSGMLYPVTRSGLTLDLRSPIALDYKLMTFKEIYDGEESDHMRLIYRTVIDGDSLYILAGSNDIDQNDLRSMMQFSLADGSCKELISSEDLLDMCGYKDGKLLFMTIDRQAFNNGQTDTPIEARVFDCDAATFEQTLAQLEDVRFYNMGGLAYDRTNDAMLVAAPGGLQRALPGAAFETAAYLTMPYYGDMLGAFVTDNGLYVTANADCLYVRSADPKDLPKSVLKVAGASFYDDSQTALDAYNAAHPECPVVYDNNAVFNTAEAIYQDMMSDSASDIYYVHSPALLEVYAKKGYCMDVSDSTLISQTLGRMYPCYQKRLANEGRIFGVPFESYSVYTLTYSPYVLSQLGLTEKELPQTISELADFAVKWVDDYGYEHPELQLFEYINNMRSQLISMAFVQQLAHADYIGQPVSFDTKQMREVLSKIDSVSSIIKALDPKDGTDVYSDYYSDYPTALFADGNVFDNHNYTLRDYIPWQISLSADMPTYYDAPLGCLLVNPNTAQKDNALAFLEEMVQHLGALTKIVVFPDYNEPVEDNGYAQNLEYYDKKISELTESIAKCTDEAERKTLQEQLSTHTDWKNELEANRYRVTSEQIARYRTMAEYVVPPSNNMNVFSESKNLQTLLERYYADPSITAEQFIADVEKILQMIHLENQ